MTGVNPFRGAIEVLEREGWLQGDGLSVTYVDDDGYHAMRCLVAAATVDRSVDRLVLLSLDRIAVEQFPDRTDGWFEGGLRPAAQFNDHPDTTLDDVVLVLEKAAVKWDEEHGS